MSGSICVTFRFGSEQECIVDGLTEQQECVFRAAKVGDGYEVLVRLHRRDPAGSGGNKGDADDAVAMRGQRCTIKEDEWRVVRPDDRHGFGSLKQVFVMKDMPGGGQTGYWLERRTADTG